MALTSLKWVTWLLDTISEDLLVPIARSGKPYMAMGIAATKAENILRLIVISYLLLPFTFSGNTIVPLTLCGIACAAMGFKSNFAKNILRDMIAFCLVDTFLDAVAFLIYKILGLCWALTTPAARSGITKKDLQQNVSAIMGPVRHVATAGVFCACCYLAYGGLYRITSMRVVIFELMSLVEVIILPISMCGLFPKLLPGPDHAPVIWEDSDAEDDPAEANRPEAPPMPSSECQRPSTVISSPHSDALDSQSRRQLREENLALRQELAHVRECKLKLRGRYRRNNEELLTTQAKVELHEGTLVGVLNRYIALKAAYDLQAELIDALENRVGTVRSRPAATTAEHASAEHDTLEGTWTEVQAWRAVHEQDDSRMT